MPTSFGTVAALAGIAVANNLDNTAVGIALGVGGVRISAASNVWISAITFLVTAVATLSGGRVGAALGALYARAFAAAVLLALGLWMLKPEPKGRPAAKSLEGDRPPTTAQLLANPLRADRDASRHIDLREATVLGVALCVNNVGGGIGAGLAHLSAIWLGAASAAISFLVLWLGQVAGAHAGVRWLGRFGKPLAGLVLVAVGIEQLV